MKEEIQKWVNKGRNSGIKKNIVIHAIGHIAAGKTELLKALAKALNLEYADALTLDGDYFKGLRRALLASLKGRMSDEDFHTYGGVVKEFKKTYNLNFLRSSSGLSYADMLVDSFVKSKYGIRTDTGTLFLDIADVISWHEKELVPDGLTQIQFIAPGAHEKSEKITNEDVLCYYLNLDFLSHLRNSSMTFLEGHKKKYERFKLEEPSQIASSIASSLQYLSKSIYNVAVTGIITNSNSTTSCPYTNPSEIVSGACESFELFCEKFYDGPIKDITEKIGVLNKVPSWSMIDSVKSDLSDIIQLAYMLVKTGLQQRGINGNFKLVSFREQTDLLADTKYTFPCRIIGDF